MTRRGAVHGGYASVRAVTGSLRALALLAATAPLGLALGACGNAVGPEDPAVAAAGTGIPMGAPEASGVRFDPLPGRGEPGGSKIGGPSQHGLPSPLPPDPFDPLEHPPSMKDGGPPATAPRRPPRKGMQL